MKQRICLSDSRGFSLIELMIAAAISSVIVLGFASTMAFMNKSTAVVESRSARTTLGADMRQVLSEKGSCLTSFVARPTIGTNMQEVQVRMPTNDIIGQGETALNYGQLRTDHLRLTNWQTPITRDGKSYHSATMMWAPSSKTLDRVGNQDQRFSMREQSLMQIIFEVDAGTLTSCFAVSPDFDLDKMTEQMCAAFGGTLNSNGTCETNASSGIPCPMGPNSKPYGLSPNTACAAPTGKEIKFEDLPADQIGQYYWQCKIRALCGIGGCSLNYAPTQNPQPNQSCYTTRKKVTFNSSTESLPGGTRCTHPDEVYGASTGVFCEFGEWVNKQNGVVGGIGGDGSGADGGAGDGGE